MEEKSLGPRLDEINKALAEYNAELVLSTQGEQIMFKSEEDKVMFLLRYS